MITRMNASPRVSGTNRKWYSAVTANCSRDRSTSSSVSMGAPGGGRWVGGMLRVGQLLGDGGGVGAHRAAVEEGIEDRRDQDELDGDRQRDLSGERMLQEGRHGLSHGLLLIARAVPASGRRSDIYCPVISKG